MEGPAVKRPKLLAELVNEDDWSRWFNNLQLLQTKLLTGCLCHLPTKIELQRPCLPSLTSVVDSSEFPVEYTYQFISTINLLSHVALSQQSKGFICTKVSEMATSVSMDECIWEMLLEFLDTSEKFLSFATSKCLVSFLLWTKLPQPLNSKVFEELLTSLTSSTCPVKISNILEIIRAIIEFKEEDDHPLEIRDTRVIRNPELCTKLEMDLEAESENESDVKNMCIKSLANWWTRLLTKFNNMMSQYSEQNENAILSFLSLWQSVISVKSNLSVVETKHFYFQIETFVPHLSSALPASLWKRVLDVFNEILCYGSTLSLQDSLPDEPCNLAHLIIRHVKNRQFLQGVPYTSRTFYSFGGSSIGPVDWEWESEQINRSGRAFNPATTRSKNTGNLSLDKYTPPAVASSSKSFVSSGASSFSTSAYSLHQIEPRKEEKPDTKLFQLSEVSASPNNDAEIPILNKTTSAYTHTSTIYIGPCSDGSLLNISSFTDATDICGDKSLLQKVVLLVLKCVAVTVKETRDDDSDTSCTDDDSSTGSTSESDTNDMIIIEKSIREVFQHLDSYVKSLLPFHPSSPLGEWIVKLFADQDDALIEGMLCTLDSFTCFLGRIQIPQDFYATLNPVRTFIAFAGTVSEDKDTFLDLLMSNETCFLLYLLRFLKYVWKNWTEFVTSCGRELEKIMGLLIRLRIALDRLVEKALFPYNINPVVRLLERCEEIYESNNSSSSSSNSSSTNTNTNTANTR